MPRPGAAQGGVPVIGRVMTVCTGNICRSPLLERVLQSQLDQRWGPGAYEVTSAGTHGLEGEPMDERAAAVLSTYGADARGFVARRLRPRLLAGVDLVLTATLDQRARVVRADPLMLRRAFTFREFAVLADSVSDDEVARLGVQEPEAAQLTPDHSARLRALARLLSGKRGAVRVAEPDIVDPFRQRDEVYAAMDAQIRDALPSVLRVLT